MTAFDTHRPPLLSDIETCVHCGFCLPTCPTYTPLWNEEMDSPRGRIVLMSEGLQPGSAMSDELALHLDRCLGCMACVTACPSGVRYDRLIERARPQVERHHDRSAGERLFRRLVFATFTHPRRLRRFKPLVAIERRVGVGRRILPAGSRLGALARLGRGITPRPAPKLPAQIPAAGERRATVGLLQGCVQRVFFGHVNEATARVLAAEGYDVVVPEGPRCCGALQLHTGYEAEAIERAKETIAAFEGCDVVCVNAAGCGSSMKAYGDLFAEEPEWAERADAFAGRVRDFSELVAEPAGPRRDVLLRVAYHDACHLAHAQGIRAEPRAALRSIPGLELVEPAEWAICCGSAGIWNLLNPEPAAELGRRKAANLAATCPDAIAAANPGCTLQIAAHLERKIPIYHPAELLLMSIEGQDGA
ncbi:MAG TPA: (Fe-S)-binding protein [Gaiellaceae bacterium]|nr:(Fe-S)-binding protein [Gaiellaceae bacterium]